jgi:signal transduction histidine kinase/DNA-binding response OmpR family regulator
MAQNEQEIDSIQNLVEHTNDVGKKASLLLSLSKLTENKNVSQSRDFCLQAENFAKKNNDNTLLSKIIFQLGYLNYKEQKDDKALLCFDRLDSIYKIDGQISDAYIKSKLYRAEISKFTYTLEGLEQSKKYLDEMNMLSNSAKDTQNIYMARYRIGDWHLTKAQVEFPEQHADTARVIFKEVLSFFLNNNDTQNTLRVYQDLYALENQLQNTAAAENYLFKKLELSKTTHDTIEMAKSNYLLGRFYRLTKQHDKTLPYLFRAKELFDEVGYSNSDYKLRLINNFTLAYDSIGDYENAYKWSTLSYQLKDSLDRNRNRELTLGLQEKYQAEKKEQEIALLNSENQLRDQKLKSQRNLYVGGLALTSITGILLFFLYRNRQKTNKRLKELDTAKSNFFTNISHEIRTPLSLIQGPIEEQLKKEDLPMAEKKNLTLAKNNAVRLHELVNQILDLSKLESGQYHLNINKGPLNLFLKNIMGSFDYSAKQKNQSLTHKISVPKENYFFDADVVQKVLTNLLANAIKYSPENEKIHLHAQIKNEHLQVEILNSGVSLSPTEIAQIFKRFHRVNETEMGSGVGLALTRELVQLHKGSINALNEENSMIFSFEIPVTENHYTHHKLVSLGLKETINDKKTVKTSTIPEKDQTDKTTNDDPILLVVEDNSDLRDYISSLFENDFKIITAENGKKGFKKALQAVPDLIITDLMMPEEDGLVLTENCKSHDTTSHIPIVMLTAKAGDENELEGLKTGADDYLTKPFNTEILKQKVHNLLEARKKLQSRFSKEVILTPKEIAVDSYDERFLNSLQNILDTQLTQSDFNAAIFAKALSMSRMQLHRKLKALTGHSTTEFIRAQRIKLAAQILKKSEVNISEVGYMVGFNNHSYFTKCFKEHFGISPTTYVEKR